jgi:hypothetical protein
MKLAGCGKEIFVSLSRQFDEGIVFALRRQLNQIYFCLPEREIMQGPLAQIHRYHCLPPIEDLWKKESELLGKIVWRTAR